MAVIVKEAPRVILVVEDEPNVLGYVHRVLESEGFVVEKATTAEEALAVLREVDGVDVIVSDAMTDPATVVVSDIKLPGMNGCEFARQALKLWPKIRMLFISGYGVQDLIVRGICPGDLPLLQKPFPPETLIEAIKSTLARPPWEPPEWRP